MKIILKYREFELGSLSYENNDYVYNSFPENEEKAKKLTFGLLNYNLYNSKNLKSKKLFVEFLPWLNVSARADIINLAKLKAEDSDWDILCKMAKINLSYGDFSLINA